MNRKKSVKIKKGVSFRSGKYHLGILKREPEFLFDMFRSEKLHKIFWQGGRSSKFHRISNLRFGEGYVAGALVSVKREPKVEESYPLHIQDPRGIEVENPIDGSIWFYIDTENNVILEDNSKIKREEFGPILSQIISKYVVENHDEWMILVKDLIFSITFDRDRTEFEEFFWKLKKLTKISFIINTPDNPFEDEFAADLAKILKGVEKGEIGNEKTGLDKDLTIVQSTMSLTADGHLNTRLEGRDDMNFKQVHECNGKNDDKYPIGTMPSDIDLFVTKARECLVEVRAKRSDRKQVP